MSGAPSVNKQIRLAWRGGIGKDLMFIPPLRDVLSVCWQNTLEEHGEAGEKMVISVVTYVLLGGGGTSGHQDGGKKM